MPKEVLQKLERVVKLIFTTLFFAAKAELSIKTRK